MATAFQLDAETLRALDDLVATGRWHDRDAALRDSVSFLHDSIGNDTQSVAAPTPEDLAGIERGIADANAGRLLTIDEVFDELERRCRGDG